MRNYSKVSPQFWIGTTGKKLRKHGIECQLVSFYLLTCSHSNMIGMYYLPKVYIAHECGLSLEGALKGLDGAIEAGFCAYDEDAEVVWVFEMAIYQIDDQLKEGDNRVLGVQNEYNGIPECQHLRHFYKKYHQKFHIKTQREIQAPYKPLASQEQEQEQKAGTVTVTVTGAGAGAGAGIVADDKSSAADQKPKTETAMQTACKKTWSSYSAAYFDRYGTEPVRNATVNSQVKSFVQRIGCDESPLLAAWFLSHRDAFYVKGGHAFGLLTRDCEKLRTEWATGRQVTGADARRIEKGGGTMSAAREILAERGES